MDEFDQAFAKLKRSPFGEVDANDVFQQAANMPSVPTSGIEDIGFTPEQLGLIRDGLYNGDFRTPPPEGDGVELDDLTNKLPGWSYVKTGTDVIAKWITDSGGGHIRFYTSDISTDQAYIEQIVPVSSTIRTSLTHVLWVDHGGSAGVPTLWAKGTYLKSDGTVTGANGFANLEPSTSLVEQIAPNGISGVPSDAHFLRIQIGVTADDAADISVNGVRLEPVLRSGVWWETISGNKDDWTPESASIWGAIDTLHIDGGAADRTISGLTAPALEGTTKLIHNGGATNNIILQHDAGGGSASSANNRFYCQSDADLTISVHGSVFIRYFGDIDGSHLRWRVVTP